MEVGHDMTNSIPEEAGALSSRSLLGGGAEHGLGRAQEAGDMHHARPVGLHGHLAQVGQHGHLPSMLQMDRLGVAFQSRTPVMQTAQM